MFRWMRSRDSKQSLTVATSSPLLPERGPASPMRARAMTTPPTPTNWKIRSLIILIGFGIVYILYMVVQLSSGPVGAHTEELITREQFTVVINTFKRLDNMQEAVQFYSSCPYVSEIYVTWSEPQLPPENLVKNYHARSKPHVAFMIHGSTSLNNRFIPLSGLAHKEGIFSVDDDIRVPCHELGLAFETWRNSPHSLVGFIPRIHIRGAAGALDYRCWWNVWWHGAYSIILTKAAFLHHSYFKMYTEQMPAPIRKYVDDNSNCEDIAMQFLVSNHTNRPPVFVKGHLSDGGALGGISTKKNFVKAQHMDARAQCLNEFTRLFGRNPLVKSHVIVDSAANGWTNAPSTWWEYISSDLWHFN